MLSTILTIVACLVMMGYFASKNSPLWWLWGIVSGVAVAAVVKFVIPLLFGILQLGLFIAAMVAIALVFFFLVRLVAHAAD